MVIWTIKSDPQGIHGKFNLRKQPVTRCKSSNQKNRLENMSMKLPKRIKNLTEIFFFDTLHWSLTALTIQSIEGWKNPATSFLGEGICHQNIVQRDTTQWHTQLAWVLHHVSQVHCLCRRSWFVHIAAYFWTSTWFFYQIRWRDNRYSSQNSNLEDNLEKGTDLSQWQ